MQHYFKNLKIRLKKSTVNDRNNLIIKCQKEEENKKLQVNLDNRSFIIKKSLFFTVQKFLFKFLFFYSKNFSDIKLKKKYLLIFIKVFNYLNFFFVDNKKYFFKNYFLKKNKEILHLNNFFFSIKYINLKNSLLRLKEKKRAFYKKNIWIKKRKFRKRTILIFDKLFSRKYTFDRFNNFIVDSLLFFMHFNKLNKRSKKFRLIKKGLFSIFRRKYYYLFLHKKYIMNKRKWYRKPFLLNLYYFQSVGKISFDFRKRKVFKRRRRVWRQIYSLKKMKFFSNSLFFSLSSKAVDFSCRLSSKKKFSESTNIIGEYLYTFGSYLAKKYSKDKKFIDRFVSRRTRCRRSKNIFYFFRRKPKIIYFNSFKFLNNQKKFKGFIFVLFWYKLFVKKTKWKNKKLQKKFLTFFVKYFLSNKIFSFINLKVKYKFFFSMYKRRRRLFRLKRRRLTLYNKKRRRRFLKNKIKKKVLKFFLILLLTKFMKKNVNLENFLILSYSFFYQNLKKINTFFIHSIYFGHQSFYFNNGCFFNFSNFPLKKNKDLKLISLIKSK